MLHTMFFLILIFFSEIISSLQVNQIAINFAFIPKNLAAPSGFSRSKPGQFRFNGKKKQALKTRLAV